MNRVAKTDRCQTKSYMPSSVIRKINYLRKFNPMLYLSCIAIAVLLLCDVFQVRDRIRLGHSSAHTTDRSTGTHTLWYTPTGRETRPVMSGGMKTKPVVNHHTARRQHLHNGDLIQTPALYLWSSNTSRDQRLNPDKLRWVLGVFMILVSHLCITCPEYRVFVCEPLLCLYYTHSSASIQSTEYSYIQIGDTCYVKDSFLNRSVTTSVHHLQNFIIYVTLTLVYPYDRCPFPAEGDLCFPLFHDTCMFSRVSAGLCCFSLQADATGAQDARFPKSYMTFISGEPSEVVRCPDMKPNSGRDVQTPHLKLYYAASVWVLSRTLHTEGKVCGECIWIPLNYRCSLVFASRDLLGSGICCPCIRPGLQALTSVNITRSVSQLVLSSSYVEDWYTLCPFMYICKYDMCKSWVTWTDIYSIVINICKHIPVIWELLIPCGTSRVFRWRPVWVPLSMEYSIDTRDISVYYTDTDNCIGCVTAACLFIPLQTVEMGVQDGSWSRYQAILRLQLSFGPIALLKLPHEDPRLVSTQNGSATRGCSPYTQGPSYMRHKRHRTCSDYSRDPDIRQRHCSVSSLYEPVTGKPNVHPGLLRATSHIDVKDSLSIFKPKCGITQRGLLCLYIDSYNEVGVSQVTCCLLRYLQDVFLWWHIDLSNEMQMCHDSNCFVNLLHRIRYINSYINFYNESVVCHEPVYHSKYCHRIMYTKRLRELEDCLSLYNSRYYIIVYGLICLYTTPYSEMFLPCGPTGDVKFYYRSSYVDYTRIFSDNKTNDESSRINSLMYAIPDRDVE